VQQNGRTKKVTEDYLERAAFHYLGRYSSSAYNLEQVLIRKVRRRNEEGAMPSEEQLNWINKTCSKCVRLGLVDDAEYARAKAAAMNRGGKPLQQIKQALIHKGVSLDIIDATLQTLNESQDEQADWNAALTYARRRKFGPWRRATDDPEKQRKELAAMARAGHRYQIASKIINESDTDGWDGP